MPSIGRPRKYPALLEKIGDGPDWVTINTTQRTRTQVIQLKRRYPSYDFRAVPNETTGYDLQARRLDK